MRATIAVAVESALARARGVAAGRQLVRAMATPLSSEALAVRSGHGRRGVSSSAALGAKAKASDATEAGLAQQMLDFMNAADEDVEDKSKLSVSGVVLDVKNSIATVSGLRHATIGSVVELFDPEADDGACVGRGVVLFLARKVTHVALFRDRDTAIQIGMDARVAAAHLEIPLDVARVRGRAIDPLGNLLPMYDTRSTADDVEEGEEVETTTKTTKTPLDQRVTVTWGSKSVPGLMHRGPLKQPLRSGIHAIDCLKPLAYGHRFGILGPRYLAYPSKRSIPRLALAYYFFVCLL